MKLTANVPSVSAPTHLDRRRDTESCQQPYRIAPLQGKVSCSIDCGPSERGPIPPDCVGIPL